jgi:hypothetical protein
VKVGDVYTNRRGKRYCVLRFQGDQVVLWSEFGGEFTAIPRLMVPENGWTLVSEAREQEV